MDDSVGLQEKSEDSTHNIIMLLHYTYKYYIKMGPEEPGVWAKYNGLDSQCYANTVECSKETFHL